MAELAESLKLLIRKRASVKQRQTLFNKYFTEFVNKTAQIDIDKEQILELQSRFDNFIQLLQEYDEFQNEIEAFCEEKDMDKHVEDRQSFQNDYFKIIGKVKNILQGFEQSVEKCDGAPVQNDQTGVPRANIVGNSDFQLREVPVKLPLINLPTFSGAYTKWLEFKDTFESLINSNKSIGEIQKFHYLRASLDGSAKQVIESLEFSASNYQVAWDILCKRYDNKRLLVRDHILGIYEIEALKRESSEGLRNLIDCVSKHLRALGNLGEPVEYWDSLLIFQLSMKLDRSTLKEWETFKITNDLPSLSDFKDFIRGRADLLETLEGNKSSKAKEVQPQQQKAFLSFNQQQNKKSCIICRAAHEVTQCKRFLDLPVYRRIGAIKRNRMCLCCFEKNHFSANCSKVKCSKCGLAHNILLHYDRDLEKDRTSSGQSQLQEKPGEVSQSAVSLSTRTVSGKSQVLLSTALVKIKDAFGIWVDCRILMDSGSMSNFITEKMCLKLRLPTESINMCVVGISQASASISKGCKVDIKSSHSNFKMSLSCLLISKICDELPHYEVDVTKLNIPAGLSLANPDFYKPQEVDMLIGSSAFWNLIREGQIRLGDRLPVLQNSILGWIVSGEVGQVSEPKRSVCNLSCDKQVQDQLAKFWHWEEPGLGDLCNKMSLDERECEKRFESTTERSEDGKFVVAIPFKDSVERLGDSKQMALSRLFSLEKRFSKNSELKDEYSDYMREYENVGHMTEVNDVEKTNEVCFYMPHHGVMKESSTTKLRVVYDGSAKSDSGVSVNDLQYVGPKIQEDLLSILLRFREHSVAFCADTAKMYRQIWVKNEHRSFQRILWHSNPSDKVREYVLNTVTFGMASSPFLAVRCLKQLALDCRAYSPKASNVIIRDFYVDDLISGTSSITEAVVLCKQVSNILEGAGFKLRKFTTNKSELLVQLEDSDNRESRILNLGENEKTKTLGLYWHCVTDVLTYKVGVINKNEKITKRKILSDISQIFDPLGLLSACVIIPKVILQKLWLLKLLWDDPVPSDAAKEWCKFKDEMPILNTICFPRHVCCEKPIRIEIHGFSDASQSAIGACVYVKSIDVCGNVFVRLLCAKSKVAPIKALTIPKLELSAGFLLANLIKEVTCSLTVKIDRVCLWSDSQVALSWIKSPANQFQIFVSNRVAQIQSIVEPQNCFFVKSGDKPADLVSRGVLPSKLKGNSLWFEGPEWLRKSDVLPLEIEILEVSELPERRKNITLSVVEKTPWELFSRFSSLRMLKRVFAYCLRFVNNTRSSRVFAEKIIGELSVKEISDAEARLILMSQGDSFPNDLIDLKNNKVIKKGKLSNLNPFIDQEKLLRVGGRFALTDFSFNKKHPILLSAKHPLSVLIVREEHVRLMHAGPQMLLGSLRERFWVIQGRNLVRKVVHSCVVCAKVKPVQLQVRMGNLPKDRLTPQLPFSTSGVDYMGPFNFKIAQGRGRKTYKGYVCLFICFVTHSIHLEVVTSLSTEAFIAAFRRFVSRRGKPSLIYSDNGKNFVGAHSELKELGHFLSGYNTEITKIVSNEGVTWSFIPAYSPHFGGLWEAGVKTVKYYLKRAIGNVNLTYEDFSTILCQVEAIVNSRPLTPLSSSPLDLDVLTPSHFLIGKRLTSLPDPSLSHIMENKLSKFQKLQKIQQQFWHQWSKEYIAELQKRTKWKHESDRLKEGTLVVVRDDNLPPLCWRMARVIQIHPGKDGLARVATLKTADGEVKRSYAKLCPLPVELNNV